jgi:hypothetical protein
MRALSEHMARQGRTDFFGTPFTVINEKLNRRIAELEAEESKDHGEKK